MGARFFLLLLLGCGSATVPPTSDPIAVGDPSGAEAESPSAVIEPPSGPALPPIERELSEQHDMIYVLARMGRYLLLGTQGGASIVDVPSGQRVAAYDEFICSSAAVAHGAFWTGCDKRVLRWTPDEGWREYLKNDENDAEYADVLVGPQGMLHAGYGAQQWRYDPASDAFASERVTFAGTYDATYFGGELWTIRFMRSIARQGTLIPVGSGTYPASNPRRLSIDSQGRLHVEDFDAGILRWNGQRFQPLPGLSEKGTGVDYDAARNRLWLLHYTDGLIVTVDDQVVQTVDLGDLSYMRAMLLEPDGSVWVAGWPGLVRVRWDEGDPVREDVLP